MSSHKPRKHPSSSSSLVSNPGLSIHSPRLYLIAFVVFALFMTLIRNGFYFKWAESLSIFVYSGYFFQDAMRFAGGLLTYAGAFLTQFYYVPVLGSILFIALLVLIRYVSVIAFDIPEKYRALAYVPSFMLLLSVTQLGYVWLTLKSPGYFFSNTLGVIACLLAFKGYRLLTGIGWRITMTALFSIAGSPLFGFYALFAVSLFVLYELRLFFKDRNYLHFVSVFSGMALVITVPQVYYSNVYSYMQYIHIYIAGLPCFAFDMKEFIFWVPFMVLFGMFFLFTGFSIGKNDNPVKHSKSYIPLWVICSGIVVVYLFSFSDDNFKTEIQMSSALENNKFREVASYADQIQDKPTRTIVLNNNFVCMATGKPKSRNLNLSNVVSPNCVRSSMSINVLMGTRPLMYLTGQINDCYHWCMEDMVEYGMKASSLKYMVKCAVVNREYALARKYNAILSKTLFYRKWARKYQAYIDNPDLTEHDKEIKAIRNLSDQETIMGL